MTITKTASRNVAFKAVRMSESVLESQDEVIIQNPDAEEEGNDDDDDNIVLDCIYYVVLDDIGYNADLYISPINCLSKINLLVLDY